MAASAVAAIAATAVVGLSIGGLQYRRTVLDHARREQASITALRGEATASLTQASDAMLRNDLTSARVTLAVLREKVAHQPRLRDLAQSVDSLFGQIDERLARSRGIDADRARLDAFRRQRIAALQHSTKVGGLALSGDREALRRAARAALACFAAHSPGDSWELAALPSSLRAGERTEIADGCYELLLILADVEPTPEESLRRLDQAARMHTPTKAYHLRRSACLTRNGDLAGAEQERKQAEALEPVTAFDHFLVGQERLERRDPTSAIQHLNAALELEPDHFWAQCFAVACALELGLPGEAKVRLTACLQRERQSAWLYLLRGIASTQVAAAALDLAKKSPSQQPALRTQTDLQLEAADGDYRHALQLLEQEPSTKLHYILLVNRGVLWQTRGVFDKAAESFEEAIGLEPDEPEAFAAIARVYQARGDASEAVKQYGRAIAVKADRAALYRGRAEVNLSRKDRTTAHQAQALADLEAAIRLDEPGSRALARDHTQRAGLLLLDHRRADALAACEAALAIVPDSDEALRMRIEILLGMERFEDAVRSCDTLLSRRPPSVSLYELRSLARAGARDYPGAISDATEALALAPEKTALLSRRGWLYIVSDAPRLALHDFEEVLRRDGSSADAYNGRGFARLRLGELGPAVADAERALGLGKPSARDFYNAARTYARAAIIASADVRRTGSSGVAIVNHYQDRAVVLLREALQSLPAAERDSFWRNVARNDPALNLLRRRVLFLGPVGQPERDTESPP
jgi:tetratricopeptide (TPR) repeat protein